jgi:hypothetical protein
LSALLVLSTVWALSVLINLRLFKAASLSDSNLLPKLLADACMIKYNSRMGIVMH